MIKSASNYRSKRNFFEMVRFDFVVDEDLNVYIMEVRQVQIIIYVDKLTVAVQGKVNLDKSKMVHFDFFVVVVQIESFI